MQFGNNDVASKVWVAARASLVDLSGVSDGSLVLHRVAVESELRWSVIVATMTGNWWPVDDSVGASPAYFLRELVFKVGASLVGVCGGLLACGQVSRW
jgi:hypothetical protein